jgi:ParB-like chromosome segregation protein Spo0J
MNLKSKNEILVILKEFLADMKNICQDSQEYMHVLNVIRLLISGFSDQNKNPIDMVYWIPIEKISSNDYNPNSVAPMEMNLLFTSISHDGYTQPIVTVYDAVLDKYVIIDGFHRYYVMKSNESLMKENNGLLPITVLDKNINDRMASTIRHNRARGKHSVDGMSNVVFEMLDNGWDDSQICHELGMEKEELIRLKHITGFSRLFENVEYKKEWRTRRQLQIQKNWEEENNQKAEC